MIQQNGYRLQKLTHNIMSINQIQIGQLLPQFTLVDMGMFVQKIVESIESYAATMSIDIKLIKTRQIIYCYIDTELMERVMLNLISNAIKYNKKNGQIFIYVNIKKDDVYIAIKDTGVGIPKEQCSKMFNRFERGSSLTTRKKEGSGLGLPIVKSLIEVHNGKISIISKEHYGTTVSIQFPRYKGNVKLEESKIIDQDKLENTIKVEFCDF